MEGRMNPDERKELINREFERRYGIAPSTWAQAPGRVDLMGSHTDYNQGYVLTRSIDRDTWIAARPREDGKVSFQSLNAEGTASFDLREIPRDAETPWTNYVRGVAAVLQAEGYSLRGFDGLAHSTIPLSSGLSSSAALEVATARLFDQLCGLELDPVRLALLCQRAENEFVGVNCGILDQYTSAVCEPGAALLLDCRELTSQTVPIHAEMRLVICDTRAKRELSGSEYAERRAQCEEGARRLADFYPGVTALRDVTLEQFAAHEGDLPEVVRKRCRYILEENQRVLDLAEALPAGDRNAIRELDAASYAGARDLYEIVSPEMERMMEAMLGAPGVIAPRQAGAGFGGCMAAFVERGEVERFAAHVEQAYAESTGIKPHVFGV